MKFEELYKQLNKEQKKAVDHIEGPVMVIAGPGTGKTQILTLRIANILRKTDIDPENILALTFTESGAISMKKRLISFIGNDAYRVKICTFHGFCNEIIRDYPEYFKNICGFINIDEIKQTDILKNILDETELSSLITPNNNYFYLKEIKRAIEELKKEGLSFSEFNFMAINAMKKFKINKENYDPKSNEIKSKVKNEYSTIEKNIELGHIFEKYQEKLKELKYYDYSDMIIEVLNTFQEDEDLLRQIQEQYQYFLVDEYQDTNTSQNKVLELLANYHNDPNVFIVGDPKQAIFRFQGASIYNFKHFKELYPSAIEISLVENYRSSQLILDSAYDFLQKDKKLKSQNKIDDKKIQIYALKNPTIEAYFIYKKIKELIEKGVNKNDIAVLYRNHKDADELVDILEKFKITFSIKKKTNILNDLDVQKILLILNAIFYYGDEEFLFKCLHIDFFEIDPMDIYKIINYCNKNKINGYDFIKQCHQLELADKNKIIELYDKLKKWKILANNELFINLFDNVVNDIKLFNYLGKNDSFVYKIDKIDGFFDWIKKISKIEKNFKLDDFIKYLNIINENSIDLNKDSIAGNVDGVKLMTAHHAKGLEFDYVFVINLNENKWEGKRVYSRLKLLPEVYQVDKDDCQSEEFNLFFVCLTRAKKQIFITYSDEDKDSTILLPSSFISQLKDDHKEIATLDIEKEFKDEKTNFIFKQTKKHTIKDKELIKEIFEKNGLSATAFNNYLECPWKYFYRNLFRIPEIQNRALIKGNAIHYALKDFFNRYKDEGRPEKSFLIDRFYYHLHLFPLGDRDFKKIFEEGKKSLSNYYDEYPVFWENILNEFVIQGINLDENVHITGNIDKLEILKNNHVNVIDYKTGKAKTKNEILGKTKSKDENYYNQLKFYGLLLKYYQNGKYIMEKGILDFVEASGHKKPQRHEFIITKEEIDQLEEKIKKIGQEIVNLEFWNRFCNNKECKYCQLRKMMK